MKSEETPAPPSSAHTAPGHHSHSSVHGHSHGEVAVPVHERRRTRIVLAAIDLPDSAKKI